MIFLWILSLAIDFPILICSPWKGLEISNWLCIMNSFPWDNPISSDLYWSNHSIGCQFLSQYLRLPKNNNDYATIILHLIISIFAKIMQQQQCQFISFHWITLWSWPIARFLQKISLVLNQNSQQNCGKSFLLSTVVMLVQHRCL